MKRKTPQEKKALSYAKDRRNVYGESDKSSLIAIRRNKTFPTRAYRKAVNDILQKIIGEIDLEKAEIIDSKTKEIKRREWKKYPDAPLSEYLQKKGSITQWSYLWKVKNTKNDKELILTIEAKRQKDGSWTAEITELTDVLVTSETREKAVEQIKELTLQVLPDGFVDCQKAE